MGSVESDVLTIVEAAYQVDTPAEGWLHGLIEAVRPHLDQGFGMAAFEYFRPPGGQLQLIQSLHVGIPEGLAQIYSKVFREMDPEIRLRPFQMGPCVTGSQMMGMREEFRQEPHMKKFVQKFGMYDSIWITAAEPSGRGIGFHSGRSKIAWPAPRQASLWGKLAAHLSSAVRLRHRIEGAPRPAPAPEAVLDPSGRVHDASGPAQTKEARERLRDAVRDVERVRGALRRRDPVQALSDWKGLVAGRWTLIDQMERDGRRYIVARENEPKVAGPDSLTDRERQVVGFAKLGHSNKLIAYDLGIADSTVRVLIARAAAKLGVHSREELVRTYAGPLSA